MIFGSNPLKPTIIYGTFFSNLKTKIQKNKKPLKVETIFLRKCPEKLGKKRFISLYQGLLFFQKNIVFYGKNVPILLTLTCCWHAKLNSADPRLASNFDSFPKIWNFQNLEKTGRPQMYLTNELARIYTKKELKLD